MLQVLYATNRKPLAFAEVKQVRNVVVVVHENVIRAAAIVLSRAPEVRIGALEVVGLTVIPVTSRLPTELYVALRLCSTT